MKSFGKEVRWINRSLDDTKTMRKSNKNIIKLVTATITILVISIMTITFWTMINQGAKDVVIKLFHTESIYLQSGIILFAGLLLLIVFSLVSRKVNLLKAIKDILKL